MLIVHVLKLYLVLVIFFEGRLRTIALVFGVRGRRKEFYMLFGIAYRLRMFGEKKKRNCIQFWEKDQLCVLWICNHRWCLCLQFFLQEQFALIVWNVWNRQNMLVHGGKTNFDDLLPQPSADFHLSFWETNKREEMCNSSGLVRFWTLPRIGLYD